MSAAKLKPKQGKREPPQKGGFQIIEGDFPDDGTPNIYRFFLEHGRLPFITDEIKPWRYRGFLLPYIAELNRIHPAVADRWGYHIATLDRGALLDEPIPQIEFHAEFEPQIRALWERESQGVQKWLRIIEHKDGYGWSTFNQLVDWLAWALGVEREEPRLSQQAHEALYREVDLLPMLIYPSDYLGSFVAATKGRGWNPHAFYPTPHAICEMMVQMTMLGDAPEERDRRTLSVCDPCVGSGRMLLHASNYSMNLYGCDIDATMVKITKINGALYAPWMTWPLPKEILGHDVYTPPPPPADLPVEPSRFERQAAPEIVTPAEKPQPKQKRKTYRVDDLAQGSLFDLMED